MRESPTKVLATEAGVAANTEQTVTIGALDDGKVYHIKSIVLLTVNDVADASGFQITSDTDQVIWEAIALTQIATTAHKLQAHRGIAAGFTDGLGSEIVVLPDKMIVPGGYKVKTIAELLSSVDHNGLTVFGSVFKAL